MHHTADVMQTLVCVTLPPKRAPKSVKIHMGIYTWETMHLQGTHGTGKTGKMVNTNSLHGKLREFEYFATLRENSGNFNLIFFLIC